MKLITLFSILFGLYIEYNSTPLQNESKEIAFTLIKTDSLNSLDLFNKESSTIDIQKVVIQYADTLVELEQIDFQTFLFPVSINDRVSEFIQLNTPYGNYVFYTKIRSDNPHVYFQIASSKTTYHHIEEYIYLGDATHIISGSKDFTPDAFVHYDKYEIF